jgi:glucose uptake protein GlcU
MITVSSLASMLLVFGIFFLSSQKEKERERERERIFLKKSIFI